MKNILLGFTIAMLLCSIALNVAQYTGTLNAPMLAKIQPTEEQELASVLGGL